MRLVETSARPAELTRLMSEDLMKVSNDLERSGVIEMMVRMLSEAMNGI